AADANRNFPIGQHTLVQQRIDQIEHGRLGGAEHLSRGDRVQTRFARTWHRQSCTKVYGGHGPVTVIAYPCLDSARASRPASALNAAARARGTRNAASRSSGPCSTGSSLAERRFASFDRPSSRSYSPTTVSRACVAS